MKRVIFLVDMNAFFISCEMTKNPSLVGKPAAVAGNPKNRTGIILAANYEARKFGVKTAMVLHEALKLCPDMMIVPPDHRFYGEKSREVMNLLSHYSPVIQENSIDEAWLDMTGCENLFGKPIESAQKIMDQIKNELGLWCSIGISENKFLSKMASEMKKPMGITTLWKDELPSKLWPLPVDSMYGVGSKTAMKLNNMGIDTIGQLAHFDKNYLVKQLGKGGIELHNLSNGIDLSPVTPQLDDGMKSIGRSITLSQDITDCKTAKRILLELSEDVGMTARKYDKKGRTVQITIKYSDFKVITRQMTIPATYLTRDIYCAGIKLLEDNWNTNRPVRMLGISITGFNETCASDQISMFETAKLETTHKTTKEEMLERTMDNIREKYGFSKINRAALIKSCVNNKTL